MSPTSSHNGSSRTFRASQGSDEESRNAAHRSYPRHFWAVRTGEYTNVSAALKHEFGAEWLFFGLPEPGALKFMDADPGLERAEATADFALYRVLP